MFEANCSQSCPILCDLSDCSSPSSSVHEISKVKILEWVAIYSFKGSSWPRDRTHVSCISCTAGRFFTHSKRTKLMLSQVQILSFSYSPELSLPSILQIWSLISEELCKEGSLFLFTHEADVQRMEVSPQPWTSPPRDTWDLTHVCQPDSRAAALYTLTGSTFL